MRLIKVITSDIAIVKKERALIRVKKGVLSNDFDRITIKLNELERELNYVREQQNTARYANNNSKAKILLKEKANEKRK